MYEQAQPVRSPVSGPHISQTSGPQTPAPADHQRGLWRGRHGNISNKKRGEGIEMSSDTYEEAEAATISSTFREARLQRAKLRGESPVDGADDSSNRRYVNVPDTAATSTESSCPGGTNGRRVLRDFVRSYRGYMLGVTVVVATLIIVGLVLMVFINREEISQLSDTADDLKLKLDLERNRSAVLEACLREPISCPDGYQLWRGICYKAFDTPKPFNAAAAACSKDGSTLAMPRDAETNAFLISLYTSMREEAFFFFIGLQDQHEEGRFEWDDGSALGVYNSWASGEPDGYGDCVVSGVSFWGGKWYNFACDRIFRFICQIIPEHRCTEMTG